MTLHSHARRLDHIGVVVPDTDAALGVWRDVLGFQVRHRETVNDGAISLTHLSLGDVDLQLVQPLADHHPLHAWLAQHGPGLHHMCFLVDNVDVAYDGRIGIPAAAPCPHQGINGRRSVFLDAVATGGAIVELTGR